MVREAKPGGDVLVPPGYVRIDRDGAALLLREGLEDALLAAGVAFPEDVVARSPAVGLAGRGALSRVEIPGGRAILRLYWRGGLLGKLVRRLSLDGDRAANELRVQAEALARGAPVTEPLAAVTRRAGVGFRHALATRELEGARDLALVLRETRGRERRRAVSAAGEAVRRLHDAGVEHADLNLKNILVREAERGPEAWVIDLDRGRLLEGLEPAARRRNLVRLLRSFAKLAVVGGARLSPRDPFRFARAYARGDRTLRAEVVRWGRAAWPRIRARACVWRFLALFSSRSTSS
jgi:3-deoxy-D-manno-octulosonic acid kinase